LASSNGAGYLLYARGATLFAAPMDLQRVELTGPASPVLEDVAPHSNNGFSEFAFTPSGSFVYLAGSSEAVQRSLFWLDAAGSRKLYPPPPPIILAFALLPTERASPCRFVTAGPTTFRYTSGPRIE
jgi:hypothetical protein